MISDEYRKMNAQLHNQKPGYGTGGARWASVTADICSDLNTRDVLDYGCGKSRLALAMAFPINQYDPAIQEHSKRPKAADVVVCTDVLEHIEPAMLDAVLDDLRDLTIKAALLNIATRPAHKKLPDGRNAHLIVQPKTWWLPKLQDRFESIEIIQESATEFTVIAKFIKNNS